MIIRRSILVRFAVVYIMALGFAVLVVFRLYSIIHSDEYENKAKGLKEKSIKLHAKRGDICASDGTPIARSVLRYKLYMDMTVSGVKKTFDKCPDDAVLERYKKNNDALKDIDTLNPRRLKGVDFLARCLAGLTTGGLSSQEYKRRLKEGYEKGNKYYRVIERPVTHTELKAIKKFPIFEEGDRNKGGLIYEKIYPRDYIHENIAPRTLGRLGVSSRGDYGLEQIYDNALRGRDGEGAMVRMPRSWSSAIPKRGRRPIDGDNVITTIDRRIQEVALSALKEGMTASKSEFGTAVVMEVETGDIKGIANCGIDSNGKVVVGPRNYAIGRRSEPGSTFKLPVIAVAIDEGKVDTSTIVDIGTSGEWVYRGKKIRDSGKERGNISVLEAFAKSSNVVPAKIITKYYSDRPKYFVDKLYEFGFGGELGLGFVGEGSGFIKSPGSKSQGWSGFTVPAMSYGYELEITPMHTLVFYNAIANGGRLVEPRFVKQIVDQRGKVKKSFGVRAKKSLICSSETVKQLQMMLEHTVSDGTASSLSNSYYGIAGKTGTVQVADGNKGYVDEHGRKKYESSFVGYFPADDPKYTCIVVIHNPNNGQYYGGDVAGPIFKKISDYICIRDLKIDSESNVSAAEKKSAAEMLSGIVGRGDDLAVFMKEMGLSTKSIRSEKGWVEMEKTGDNLLPKKRMVEAGKVPDVVGMGISDALYILERHGFRVSFKGEGRVKLQSVRAGSSYKRGGKIVLTLEMG